MPIENAAAQVVAAVNALEHAKAVCAHLCHHGLMRRDLQRRAELIHAVIRTRRQFKAYRPTTVTRPQEQEFPLSMGVRRIQ